MRFVDGLDAANQQLINLADGSSPTDAVTLQQLQNFVRGLSVKDAVKAASTGNVNINSAPSSLDGVTCTSGDRWLLKDNTDATQNGIWQFNGAGTALTRTADANSSQNLREGTSVFVAEGSVNGDRQYVLTTDGVITPGTTAQTWGRFGGGVTYNGSNSINVTGTTISVVLTPNKGLKITAGGVEIDYTYVVGKLSQTIGDGTTTSFTVTHGLGTTDVMVTLKNLTTGKAEGIGFTTPDANTVGLAFPTAPTTNQYRVTVHG